MPSYRPMQQPVKSDVMSPQANAGFQSSGPRNGPVISQGDTAQLSYKARKEYHVNGDGVKVGFLSDSYNSLGTAHKGVIHGELPGPQNPYGFTRPVQVIKDNDLDGIDVG